MTLKDFSRLPAAMDCVQHLVRSVTQEMHSCHAAQGTNGQISCFEKIEKQTLMMTICGAESTTVQLVLYDPLHAQYDSRNSTDVMLGSGH